MADRLRSAIAHGELKPGTQLSEADLARRLGVSRNPLREGMQRLTQEGLLVPIRNRGLFVLDLTPDDIRDMYLAREAIEQAAARKVLRGDHEQAGDALLGHVKTILAASEDDDPAGISEADIGFHEHLVELSGSPRLRRMHQTSITETRMCIHAEMRMCIHAPETAYEPVEEHRALAVAVRAGDPELVETRLRAHLEDAVARLLSR